MLLTATRVGAWVAAVIFVTVAMASGPLVVTSWAAEQGAVAAATAEGRKSADRQPADAVGQPPDATGTGASSPGAGASVEPASDAEPDPLFDESYDDIIDEQKPGFPDPLESVNRGFLLFNRQVDRWLLDPVTRAYQWILPDPLETGLRNAFENIGSAPVLLNDLLQLRWRDAAGTVNRFMLNSTVGLGGFFDPAAHFGVKRHAADFGETLALIGVGSGPYFVIPVLGPTTMRDGIGGFVDSFFHPMTYLLGGLQRLTYGTGSGLSLRAEHYEGLKALEESSVDFYAALKNAFYQNRVAEIDDARARRAADLHSLTVQPKRSCRTPPRIARRLHTDLMLASADCSSAASRHAD
jgi:phospholipid-binding lipoprotein MlaA